MNRREFIGGIGAVAGMSAFGGTKERPYLKVGLLTDTHVKKDAKSCELTRGAFRVFKAQGVEAIGHCGDLADLHYDEAYRLYRETVEATYPNKATRPKLLYVYANHDLFDGNGWDRNVRPSPPLMPPEKGFPLMKEKLGIESDWQFHETKVKGVPFLVFPEFYWRAGGEKFMREKIAAACAANPKGPVVVMTHRPPRDTTFNSVRNGDAGIRKVLDEFPRVVNFHGHTHAPLWNDSCVWQGNFTSVVVGGLYEWFGCGVGVPFAAKFGYGVAVAEFYRDKIVIRRFDARDGSEYRPDAPWVIPLPFDRKTAPYAPANARRRETPVGYPAGATLKIVPQGKPVGYYTVVVPDSAHEDMTHYHRLRVAAERDGKWEDFILQERFGEFHMRPKDRKGVIYFDLSTGYFDKPGRYRFTVVPVGFFGTEGRPLSTVWTAPEPAKTELVWKADDPMRELPCTLGSAKTPEEAKKLSPPPLKDGWFQVPDDAQLQLLPPKTAWNVPKGTKLRFTADLRLDQQPDVPGWQFNLMPCSGNWRHSPTRDVELPPGKAGAVRVTKEFDSVGPERDYWLTFNCPHGGRIRVERVRVEKP